MSNPTPAFGSTDTVNITSNVPSSPDTIAIHYTSGTTVDHDATDPSGSDHFTFGLGNTTAGQPVNVVVTVQAATCSTSFTPH